MRMYDIIMNKRKGNELSKEEYWQLKKEIFQIPFHHLRKIYQKT